MTSVTKKCTLCGTEYPLTAEHFHRHRRAKSGFRGQCKQCCRERNNAHIAKSLEEPETERQCTKCNNVYPATTEYFSPSKRYRGGLQTWCRECHKNYHAENRERLNQLSRDYYAENQDKYVEYARNYRIEKKEEVNARDRERYQQDMENPELREKERERVRKRYRRLSRNPEWREKEARVRKARYDRDPQYRQKGRIYAQQRRARKRKLEGMFTQSDIDELFELQDGRCCYCGIPFHDDTPTIDHLIPVTREGSTNWPENLALACESCNSSKGAMTPEEWQSVRGW